MIGKTTKGECFGGVFTFPVSETGEVLEQAINQ